jgi:hypothetical protein
MTQIIGLLRAARGTTNVTDWKFGITKEGKDWSVCNLSGTTDTGLQRKKQDQEKAYLNNVTNITLWNADGEGFDTYLDSFSTTDLAEGDAFYFCITNPTKVGADLFESKKTNSEEPLLLIEGDLTEGTTIEIQAAKLGQNPFRSYNGGSGKKAMTAAEAKAAAAAKAKANPTPPAPTINPDDIPF